MKHEPAQRALEIGAAEKVTWLNRRVGIVLAALLFFILIPQTPASPSPAGSAVISESLTLTVYFDGFVQITHELEVNQSYPTVNVTMLSEEYQDVLVLDEEDLPLDFAITGPEAVIYSLGASSIKVSYVTQELTSKVGQYWTLTTETPVNATVILPESATVISLNEVPEQIESSNEQVTLVMPPGLIEITYVAEHSALPAQTTAGDMPWQLMAIASISLLVVPVLAIAILVSKRKKPEAKGETIETAVDVEKLLSKEKDLRPDEVRVIHFLAEKNGTAFEAELYDNLGLPRTSTWRLLKRLERMEIVDIRNSRRQNIVSIRKKYLKANKDA